MIYLKLRQAGEIVNHRRVERLYAAENLQIKRRKRKKVPITDRQPLERPETANDHKVKLRLIEPGKPKQNAYVESLNSRFRDECLNEHWFFHLRHARQLIEIWRKEYNEERPKRGLGGLAPVQHAKQLAKKSVTVTPSL